MGDDFCIPIPDEPSIKLQLFRAVRRRLLGMQNRNQFIGGYRHRASPRVCELDWDHKPYIETWKKLLCATCRLQGGPQVAIPAGAEGATEPRFRDFLLASAPDLENHGQGEIQSLVGDKRRWLRYRIGVPYHRERRFVERPVAGSLDDPG